MKRHEDWSALMARAQDGDQVAYERLLREATPYLRSLAAQRFGNKASIEDAVQDVLLAVHALRYTYDPRRPFGPWLATIARRRIIDRLRRETRNSAREVELRPAHETIAGSETNNMKTVLDRHALHAAIDDLPASQREAIRLLKLEELSLKEASSASGRSISALKVAAHRALRRLRRTFDDDTSDR